jgi:hypothetical protein
MDARMADAGLPFDTSHTAHATRSATSLAKPALPSQPCQGWRRAKAINFSPDDTPLTSADFYAYLLSY